MSGKPAFLLAALFSFAPLQSLHLHALDRYPIPSDTVIVLQRGYCERGCPAYRIVVFADGDVIWQGIDLVRKKGLDLGHVRPDQVRDIVDKFKSIDYLNLQNIYGVGGKGCASTASGMGLSVAMTSLSMDGSAHTLKHDSGCKGGVSAQITSLEEEIDKVTGSARWIK